MNLTIFLSATVVCLIAKGVSGAEDERNLTTTVQSWAADNAIIVTQASCGYLPFVYNWALHIQALGITNWISVAEDDASFAFVEDHFPGHAIRATELTHHHEKSRTVAWQTFASQGFRELGCWRPYYLLSFLEMGLSVLWSDVDSVWLRNFFELAPQGFDYVGVDDSPEGTEQDTAYTCTCLMYFQPRDPARWFLKKWHDFCLDPDSMTPEHDQDAWRYKTTPGAFGDDQQAWNQVLKDVVRDNSTTRYFIMPRTQYPNGFVADAALASAAERTKTEPSHHHHGPGSEYAWLHANYREGHDAKVHFFKTRHLWMAHSVQFPSCVASS